MPDEPRSERQIPVTTGLLSLLLGGVVTLVAMLFGIQDRFVTSDMLDAKLEVLSSQFDVKLERFRQDIANDVRRQLTEAMGGPK